MYAAARDPSFGHRRNDLVQRQIRLLAIRVSRKSACSSNGEVLPPLGFAATLPVCLKRCAQSTTTLALSSYRSATSRRDAPAFNAVVLFCFIDKKIFQNVLPVCWGERFFADSAMNQAARKFGIRTARRRNQLAGEKMEQAADLDPVSRDDQAR